MEQADLLTDPPVLRWEVVPRVAEGTAPQGSIEVDLCVPVEDRAAGFAQHRVIWTHLRARSVMKSV